MPNGADAYDWTVVSSRWFSKKPLNFHTDLLLNQSKWVPRQLIQNWINVLQAAYSSENGCDDHAGLSAEYADVDVGHWTSRLSFPSLDTDA